jgi:hypothetical protein
MYVCQPKEIISNTHFLMWWEKYLIVTAPHWTITHGFQPLAIMTERHHTSKLGDKSWIFSCLSIGLAGVGLLVQISRSDFPRIFHMRPCERWALLSASATNWA